MLVRVKKDDLEHFVDVPFTDLQQGIAFNTAFFYVYGRRPVKDEMSRCCSINVCKLSSEQVGLIHTLMNRK